MEPLVEQLRTFLTKEFRERARHGKYSKLLWYGSPERLARILLAWKKIVALSDCDLIEWSDNNNDNILKRPQDVALTPDQIRLLNIVCEEHWLLNVEFNSDDGDENGLQYMADTMDETERNEYVKWLLLHVNCQSALFGALWYSEMFSHFAWFPKLARWSERNLEIMNQLIRFYNGKRAMYRLAGEHCPFSNVHFPPFSHTEECS